MRPSRCIDELGCNAHTVCRFAHTTLQYVAHAEFAADLFHVNSAALVSECRIASDYEQPFDAREASDDVFDHSVDEVILLGVATQVCKWQHSNRRFVRKR